MSLILFHGEDTLGSYQACQDKLASYRRQGVQIIKLDGKTLELADLSALEGQTDFFITPKVAVINNLLARPKSKKKQSLLDFLTSLTLPVFLWEEKKIKASEIKKLGIKEHYLFSATEAIWSLLAFFGLQHERQKLIDLFLTSQKQYEEKEKQEATIYLIAMFLWRIQLIISYHDQNYQGPPFLKTGVAKQAQNLSLRQLIAWHQRLLAFDCQVRQGKIKPPTTEKLLHLLLDFN